MIKIYRTHDEPLALNVNTLKSAKLHRANFHRCLLNNVDATEADLSKADFRSAEMKDSVFNNVIFNDAQLIMVKANRSLFDGCVFRGTLLLSSDFSNLIAKVWKHVVLKMQFLMISLFGEKILMLLNLVQ